MTFEGKCPEFWKHACQLLIETVAGMPQVFGETKISKLATKVGMSTAKFSVLNLNLTVPPSALLDAVLEEYLSMLPLIRKIAHIKGGIYEVRNDA
jgi:hypothetical protein